MRLSSIKLSKLKYNGTLSASILCFLVKRQTNPTLSQRSPQKEKSKVVLCPFPGSDFTKSNGTEVRTLKKLGFWFTGTKAFPWVESAVICVLITLCPFYNAFEISCVSLGQHCFISLFAFDFGALYDNICWFGSSFSLKMMYRCCIF